MAKPRITLRTAYDSPTLVFRRQKYRRNSNDITPNGAPNRGGVVSDRRFATNISLYLRNRARQGHSYYGKLIGTCIRSIEWCYFQWPWVTPNHHKSWHRLVNIGGDREYYCVEEILLSCSTVSYFWYNMVQIVCSLLMNVLYRGRTLLSQNINYMEYAYFPPSAPIFGEPVLRLGFWDPKY